MTCSYLSSPLICHRHDHLEKSKCRLLQNDEFAVVFSKFGGSGDLVNSQPRFSLGAGTDPRLPDHYLSRLPWLPVAACPTR